MTAYTTSDELAFISNIGYGRYGAEVEINRKKALEGYLQASQKRKDWGRINPTASISHAIQQLAMA